MWARVARETLSDVPSKGVRCNHSSLSFISEKLLLENAFVNPDINVTGQFICLLSVDHHVPVPFCGKYFEHTLTKQTANATKQ